jgi:hypothetical protein
MLLFRARHYFERRAMLALSICPNGGVYVVPIVPFWTPFLFDCCGIFVNVFATCLAVLAPPGAATSPPPYIYGAFAVGLVATLCRKQIGHRQVSVIIETLVNGTEYIRRVPMTAPANYRHRRAMQETIN